MNKEQLISYIKGGREIEFQYKGKKYSITYGVIDGKDVISFCEFYQFTTEVESAEELLEVERDGVTVLEMLEAVSDDDIFVY